MREETWKKVVDNRRGEKAHARAWSEKEMSPYKKLRLNKYLITGLILGVLQYLIYMGGYDYILKFGPFVTHHFIELPASFVLGVGISIFFDDSGYSSLKSQVLNALMFATQLSIDFFSRGIDGLIASFIVLAPELIGFYLHRIYISFIGTNTT